MARNVADLPTALPELAIDQQGFDAPSPQLVMLNDELATQLGLSPQWLRSEAGLKFLTGHGADHGVGQETDTPLGAYTTPMATAYAGHQFGNFAGLLGDGRALLLATVEVEPGLTGLHCPPNQPDCPKETTHSDNTQAYEIQAKGTGPTPFSRGGDGKATLTSALREYLILSLIHI